MLMFSVFHLTQGEKVGACKRQRSGSKYAKLDTVFNRFHGQLVDIKRLLVIKKLFTIAWKVVIYEA